MDQKNKSILCLLREGISWTFTIDVLVSAFNFLSQILFARLLGVEAIGKYALIVISVDFSRLFFDFGFNLPLIRYQATDKFFQTAFSLTIFQALGIILSWTIISTVYITFYEYETVSLFFPGVLLLIARIIGLFASIIYAPLETSLNYRYLSISRLIATTIGIATAFYIAYANFGVLCLVIRDLIISITLFILVWIKIKPKIVLTLDFSIFSKLLKFSFGVWILNSFERAAKRIDYALVGFILGRDALGIYFQIRGIFEGIIGVIVKPVQTVLFSFFCQNGINLFIVQKNIKFFSIIVIALALLSSFVISSFGDWILLSFLGEEWIAGSALLPGFILYLWAIFLFENIKVLSMAKDTHYIPIVGRIVQLFLIIILTIPLTLRFGLSGSGFASGFSALSLTLCTVLLFLNKSSNKNHVL